MKKHFFVPVPGTADCDFCGYGQFNVKFHFQPDESVSDAKRQIQAYGDLLLVKPCEVEEMVRGMVRPGSSADRPSEGVVLLAGPGRYTEFGTLVPVRSHVGDLIAFPSYAGKEIVDPRGFPAGSYLMVRESELLLNYGPAAELENPHQDEETHE